MHISGGHTFWLWWTKEGGVNASSCEVVSCSGVCPIHVSTSRSTNYTRNNAQCSDSTSRSTHMRVDAFLLADELVSS